MKLIANISRVFVGVLFIISGFVKIVDPIGTAIKLEEYFVVFGQNFGSVFETFIPFALFFSILITSLEIILGFALLFLYQVRTTIILLLLQIVFFTFLTFYSATTGEVTDCGCFGDAMPLTPWQSFSKDLILLVFIVILFLYRKRFNSISDNLKGTLTIAFITLSCLLFAKYNLDYLPVIDFRPYKVGANIHEKRNDGKAGVYHYKMEREGVEKVFEQYPSDGGWTYKDVVVVKEPTLPSINDFNLFDVNGIETTEEVLTGNVLFIISQKIDAVDTDQIENLGRFIKATSSISNLKIVLLTGSGFEKGNDLLSKMGAQLPTYIIDEVVIKAMIRANPGILLLKDGVVQLKRHYNDLPTIEELKSNL